DRVKARQAAPNAWIRGRGWDQNDWATTQFPTHQLMSAATQNNPVVLGRIDSHAILANAKAMQLANITKATPDPTGGRIIRDANGDPTGVFVDNATNLIERVIPDATAADIREGVRLAMRQMNSFGLTGMHDAGAGCGEIRLYEQM